VKRRVAAFEVPIKKADGKQGFIDLLWKGTLLVEHKSQGRSLDRAGQQARDYFPGLLDHERPKYILVPGFVRFRLYDLDEGTEHELGLAQLHENLHLSSTTRSQCRQRWCAPMPPSTALWMPATAPPPSPPS
jgi:hypothetical protein